MSAAPEDLLFSKDHTWVRIEGKLARIGITEELADSLGRVMDLELPEEGVEVGPASIFAAVNGSNSGMIELYCPIEGTIASVNHELEDVGDLLASDPYDEGWICTLAEVDPVDCENLMDPEDYAALLDGEL
jgi:glycine cleavage system H protein